MLHRKSLPSALCPHPHTDTLLTLPSTAKYVLNTKHVREATSWVCYVFCGVWGWAAWSGVVGSTRQARVRLGSCLMACSQCDPVTPLQGLVQAAAILLLALS